MTAKIVSIEIKDGILSLLHNRDLQFWQMKTESTKRVIEALSVGLKANPYMSMERAITLHQAVLVEETMFGGRPDTIPMILNIFADIKDQSEVRDYLLRVSGRIPDYLREEAHRTEIADCVGEWMNSRIGHLKESIQKFLERP